MQGSGSTRITSSGTLTINGAGNKVIDQRTLQNQGALNIDLPGAEAIQLSNGAQLLNEASGALNILADVTISGAGATDTFINRGVITSSAANVSIDVDFENQTFSNLDITAGTCHTQPGRWSHQ